MDRAKRLKALGNAVVPAQAYPFFKAITEIEKIKLAQTSYDLRPKEESKLLSAIASKGKSLIQELTGTSPAEKARNLAKRLETGQITKEQLSESFNLVGSPLFEESINKLIQGQRLTVANFQR